MSTNAKMALTTAILYQTKTANGTPYAGDKNGRSRLYILLVDDNSVDRKVLFLMLKYLGFHADVATNARDAILAVQRQFYHVVLMDIQMPEIDGIQATKIIRQSLSDRQYPHIIAVTDAESFNKEVCIKAGMNGYIAKPIDIMELKAIIKSILPRDKI